uniref:Intron associated endonuclease n=1 Tax=CrAss-like virus sp. ctYsL76 TaxID=2826826 RepID=A0A8S5QLR0_9CAUD|nr:MAG TPA: intron associated endonuclease [CrAss-like virus sp. ctYsL76]
MELKYIVYVTVNLCNGKLYFGVHRTNPNVFDGYIGCGIYRQSNATQKYPLHTAVRKYGYDNFKRTIIQIFPDTDEGKKQAYNLETQIVNTTLLRSKNVYNSKIGGEGGNNTEPKRIYKYSLSGEFLQSYKNINDAALSVINNGDIYNIVKSIRNNCLGYSSSAYNFFWGYKKEFTYRSNKVKVAQYTISGKFIRYYDSITEAEEKLQINTIKQAINKKCLSGGFQWRVYDCSDKDIDSYYTNTIKNDNTKIVMLDNNGNFIKEYRSINECAKENNLKSSQINRVLRNIIRSHKGFKFKYI